MLRTRREVGESLATHWQPAFEKRPTDPIAQEAFLEFVSDARPLTDWAWEVGAWREALAGVPDSAPGPDGLCYSFWRNSPDEWASCVDALAESLSAGQLPPDWLLDSTTIFIPKGDASTTTDDLTLTASELRPITLMQTIAKIIAYQANPALSGVAKVSVASPQRGFVRHRNISENIVEFEG